jgi:hypothetical protein
MCYGNWYRFWGVPYYFGGVVGILFYLVFLLLVVWAVVTVVKSLTNQRARKSKEVNV